MPKLPTINTPRSFRHMIRAFISLVAAVTISTCDRPPAPDSRVSPARALEEQAEAAPSPREIAPVEPVDDTRFDPRVAAPPAALTGVLETVGAGQSLDEALSAFESERDELEGLALYRLGQDEALESRLASIRADFFAGRSGSAEDPGTASADSPEDAEANDVTNAEAEAGENVDAAAATNEAPEAAPNEEQAERFRAELEAHIATSALGRLESLDHPLSPWARFELAKTLVSIEPTMALLRIESLLDEGVLPIRSQLQRLKAEALLALSRHELAVPILERLLRARADTDAASEIAMPLAYALSQTEGTSRQARQARERALALYRRVFSRAPATRMARRASERAEAVLASLPPARRRALERVPLDDRFFEAAAYARGNAHSEAERAYHAIVAALGEDHPRRCEALLGEGSAILKQRDRERGAPFLARVAEACAGPTRPWARYKAGRAYVQIGNPSRARFQYDALLRESPRHRLADDVRLYRSLLDEAQEPSAFVAGLESLIDEYPEGDMRSEAHFRLGMFAYNRGDFDEAARVFWRGRGEGEDAEDVRGRCAYWHARSLERHLAARPQRGPRASSGAEDADESTALDEEADAPEAELANAQSDPLAAYKALIEAWPLSFYAQLAMRRLVGRDDTWLASHLARLQTDTPPLIFEKTEAMESPGFERVLALLRAEDFERAYEELEALELVGRQARQASVWLSAALFSAAGDLPRATRLVRSRLHAFRSMMPEGQARARWRLAYPRAFSPLIETTAARAEVPPSLVRAIAREESSFNPRAVSWAHAYGLVQVIVPTARRHGRGLRINADTLMEPRVNLTVGTRFMAWLLARYDGQVALIPAAYNAGHGALDEWLAERGDLPFDEFVDSIPFAETRRYTRRVLQTYGVYSVLDTGELPELPNMLVGARPRESPASQ